MRSSATLPSLGEQQDTSAKTHAFLGPTQTHARLFQVRTHRSRPPCVLRCRAALSIFSVTLSTALPGGRTIQAALAQKAALLRELDSHDGPGFLKSAAFETHNTSLGAAAGPSCSPGWPARASAPKSPCSWWLLLEYYEHHAIDSREHAGANCCEPLRILSTASFSLAGHCHKQNMRRRSAHLSLLAFAGRSLEYRSCA